MFYDWFVWVLSVVVGWYVDVEVVNVVLVDIVVIGVLELGLGGCMVLILGFIGIL